MIKVKLRIDETGEWVRCGKCGNRLFKVNKNEKLNDIGVEIKCRSCKTVNISRFEQINNEFDA